MATTLSLTTTYAGELAGEIILAAKIANPSLQYVTVKENVPYKMVARKLVDNFTSFEAPTCDFTPLGTVTLTERILTLEEFQVQRQVCKKDFFADWSTKDVMSGKLNAEIQNAIIANLTNTIMAANETIMWQGVNATTGQYDGFGTLIDANAGSDINFVASPVALTSSNIIAKIDALIAACPVAVKGSTEKPTIFMNQTTYELFMIANMAAGNGWYTYSGPAVTPKYMGLYDIAVCPGIAANTMYMAQKSNLWWGTWKSADMNEISLLDMSPLDLSQNVRFSARFYMGAQIAKTSEIAAYGPGLS